MMRKALHFVKGRIPKRLALQLTMLFMATFTCVMMVSSVLLYNNMERILSQNYEDASVAMFRQSDYNISTLAESIDLISRKLVLDADLYGLFEYARLTQREQVHLCSGALKQFSNILSNYQFICSIVYYTSEGLVLKSTPNSNDILFGKAVLNEWFYASPAYQRALENRQKLTWFGGYTAGDFGLATLQDANPSGVYVSAARNTRSYGAIGTLVINISAEHFASVFGEKQQTDSNGSWYIMDDGGIVLAGGDGASLGRKAATFRPMTAGQQTESFTTQHQERDITVVYYRLATPVGILVSEIPHSVIVRNIQNIRLLIVAIFLASILLAFLLFRWWIKRLMTPLHQLTSAFQKVEQGHLGLTIPEQPPANELGELVDEFNLMSLAIEQVLNQNIRNETEKRDLEMQALRTQINPHFIYNTLNTIKWMAMIDRKTNIADCVTIFSKVLEVNLRSNTPLCTISDEMEYLENYIKIMNFRFSEGLSIEWDIPQECMQLLILRFTLQPIVENSIQHGLAGTVGGVIRILARQHEGLLVIEIRDNGTGFTPERLADMRAQLNSPASGENKHIGLVNIYRRIRLHYGYPYGLKLQNAEDGGARVTVTIPASAQPAG